MLKFSQSNQDYLIYIFYYTIVTRICNLECKIRQIKNYRSSSPTVYVDAWFGQANGTSLNIEPDCKGSELDLAFCRLKKEWGNQSCSHSDDAGVSCTTTALGKPVFYYYKPTVCLCYYTLTNASLVL